MGSKWISSNNGGEREARSSKEILFPLTYLIKELELLVSKLLEVESLDGEKLADMFSVSPAT